MCLARISKAIKETETELQQAAKRTADALPDRRLSAADQKVLDDRLQAFGKLQADLERITKELYGPEPPITEDPGFPRRR
jgi:hypothetical protein